MSVSAFETLLIPAEQCVCVCVCVGSSWVAQHLYKAGIVQGKRALWCLEREHTRSHLNYRVNYINIEKDTQYRSIKVTQEQ